MVKTYRMFFLGRNCVSSLLYTLKPKMPQKPKNLKKPFIEKNEVFQSCASLYPYLLNNDALLITEVLHAYNADRANWLFELARPA